MPKNVKLFISVPARALLFRVWEQLFQAEREIPWKIAVRNSWWFDSPVPRPKAVPSPLGMHYRWIGCSPMVMVIMKSSIGYRSSGSIGWFRDGKFYSLVLCFTAHKLLQFFGKRYPLCDGVVRSRISAKVVYYYVVVFLLRALAAGCCFALGRLNRIGCSCCLLVGGGW